MPTASQRPCAERRLDGTVLTFLIYFSFVSRPSNMRCKKHVLRKILICFLIYLTLFWVSFVKPAFKELDIIEFIFYTLHVILLTVDLKWPL